VKRAGDALGLAWLHLLARWDKNEFVEQYADNARMWLEDMDPFKTVMVSVVLLFVFRFMPKFNTTKYGRHLDIFVRIWASSYFQIQQS
jgi:hypothetical protein